MNQKWQVFQQELNNEINRNYNESYNYRFTIFYNSIKKYIGKEIKYSSNIYDELSKKLTEFNLRTKKEKSVTDVLNYNKIHVQPIENGIVILGDDKNEQ